MQNISCFACVLYVFNVWFCACFACVFVKLCFRIFQSRQNGVTLGKLHTLHMNGGFRWVLSSRSAASG
ncbi:hypothetical protein HMPREF3204_00994 [Gardnerella pickettii]|nr:hypothetical protein HMPREF1583_00738 [Gardnerella vaginalis JCP8151B]KXA15728.1 hypothetical protein HMPREF3204_00994 [Gardnerella pickettii]